LADEMPNLEKRVDHILTKQVFGIGITYLTSLLARRSVYCSKHAKGKHSVAKGFANDAGNIWFERLEHTWEDGKCAYCGASQKTLDRGEGLETHAYAFIHSDDLKTRVAELFGGDMQFDVIIGNPPYQLDDGGFGKSAAPVYHHFVKQAKALEPRYLSMVIPSRWFAGGKGLDEFRESMLTDNRLRSIDDYLSASDVFPGVGLKGGVCFFLWDRENPGPCLVTTHFRDEPPSTTSRQLLEEGVDVFIRFNEGLSILKKVVAVESEETNSLSLPKSKRFDRMVSSSKPFGLRTFFQGKTAKSRGDVSVYQNGGTGYIEHDAATGEPTGILKDNAEDLVDRVVPDHTREMNLRAARAALREAARFGVTTIQDNSAVDALPTYQALRAKDELTARFYVWRYAAESLVPLKATGVRTGLGDDWIRLGALKILSDGSIGSATAALFEPFVSNPASRGLLLFGVEELERLIREADAAGFQLAVHAIGDRANSLVLDAFEKAARENGARIIVEKPVGRDLASAQAINSVTGRVFDESQIFRIDHYLGKETVQNLMVVRFANSIFEPIWNHKYIDHVQITVSEAEGVGTRAGYYEEAGALRDMVQNCWVVPLLADDLA
jgi:hypothetical protein